MTANQWPEALKTAIKKELAGNTRRDLLTWARRVLRNPTTPAELDKAQLVLALDEGNAK